MIGDVSRGAFAAGASAAAFLFISISCTGAIAQSAKPAPVTVQSDSVLGLLEAAQFIQKGDYSAAATKLSADLERVRRAYGDASLETARVKMYLLQVKATTRDASASAIRMGEEIIETLTRIRGPEARPIAFVHNMLGGLNANLGRFDESERAYQRALDYFEKSANPTDKAQVADVHSNYGDAMLHAGRYDRARELFTTVLGEYTDFFGAEDIHVGVTWQNLGQIHAALGEFAQARACYARAAANIEKNRGRDQVETATVWVHQALVAKTMGDDPSARAAYAAAIPVLEAKLPPSSLDLAWAYRMGAEIAEAARDYAGARSLVERAHAIEIGQYGDEDPNLGAAHAALGALLYRTGDVAAAEPRLRRALLLLERSRPEDPITATTLEHLARVRSDFGDPIEAGVLCDRALAIRTKALGAAHPEVAVALELRGTIARASEDRTAAFAHVLEGESIARQHLRLVARSLPERFAMEYAAERRTGMDQLLSMLADRSSPEERERTWDAVIRGRALVFDEIAFRHHASWSSRDTLVQGLRDSLEAARSRLAYLTLASPRDLVKYENRTRPRPSHRGEDALTRHRTLVQAALREKERYEELLGGHVASTHAGTVAGDLGLDGVAAALPARSALVAFVQYTAIPQPAARTRRPLAAARRSPNTPAAGTPSYLVFVLRAGEQTPEVVPLGRAAAVDHLVATWRALVTREADPLEPDLEDDCFQRGTALRRRIWDPVARVLGAADQVFVVPDGAINLVNFAALPVGRDAFLVERGPLLHTLSAERDLAAAARGAEGSGLLALGNPDFDHAAADAAPAGAYRGMPPGCVDPAAARFEPLPAADQETAEIARLWPAPPSGAGAAVVRHGGAASEAAFKRESPGKRVLHLATHGFFLDPECRRADVKREDVRTLVQNPLVLSGLALAGANEPPAGPAAEDGLLTAEEIAALDLSSVEWVVLSACDTGLGVLRRGEGVFGLRRGFAVAGARTLIMSLWKVNDAAARDWMRSLYHARFADGVSTPEAVRGASRAMLRERRERGQSVHPATWAAFIAAGQWR